MTLSALCFSTASPPDFSRSPLRALLKSKTGSTVTMECRPQAFPTAISMWRKGNEPVQSSERYRYNLFLSFLCILVLNSSYSFFLTIYSFKASPQQPCYVHTICAQPTTEQLSKGSGIANCGSSLAITLMNYEAGH